MCVASFGVDIPIKVEWKYVYKITTLNVFKDLPFLGVSGPGGTYEPILTSSRRRRDAQANFWKFLDGKSSAALTAHHVFQTQPSAGRSPPLSLCLLWVYSHPGPLLHFTTLTHPSLTNSLSENLTLHPSLTLHFSILLHISGSLGTLAQNSSCFEIPRGKVVAFPITQWSPKEPEKSRSLQGAGKRRAQ